MESTLHLQELVLSLNLTKNDPYVYLLLMLDFISFKKLMSL